MDTYRGDELKYVDLKDAVADALVGSAPFSANRKAERFTDKKEVKIRSRLLPPRFGNGRRRRREVKD